MEEEKLNEIDKAILGTLLGSVIGYALGRFKNRID